MIKYFCEIYINANSIKTIPAIKVYPARITTAMMKSLKLLNWKLSIAFSQPTIPIKTITASQTEMFVRTNKTNPKKKVATNCNPIVRTKLAALTSPISTLKTLTHALAKNAENQTAPMPNATIVATPSHNQFIGAICCMKKLQKLHELIL